MNNLSIWQAGKKSFSKQTNRPALRVATKERFMFQPKTELCQRINPKQLHYDMLLHLLMLKPTPQKSHENIRFSAFI
jgi:hypothetical protein